MNKLLFKNISTYSKQTNFQQLLQNKKLLNTSLVKQTFCTQNQDTIFEKIVKRQIPADIVYEDEHCLAFRDVSPKAPVHVLLIPKKLDGLTQLSKATDKNKEVLGHMMLKVGDIARLLNLDKGYRVVINDGPWGQQTVYHLHLHIFGGQQMSWPPGTEKIDYNNKM